MTEADIEIILQGAKEKYPDARPRIISDNGPQFIAKDFKEFNRISGLSAPCRFTRNRTGRSSAGTNHSKESASGQGRIRLFECVPMKTRNGRSTLRLVSGTDCFQRQRASGNRK